MLVKLPLLARDDNMKVKKRRTANTVGIINKLVMVFALTTVFNTAFTTLINPDTRQWSF